MRHALLAGLAATAAITAIPATALAATPWVGTQAVSAAGNGASTQVGNLRPVPPRPVLVTNDAGQSVAAWPGEDGSVMVSRRPASGAWTTPQAVSTGAHGWQVNCGLDVAIDAAGDATVLWDYDPQLSDATTIYAATSTAGGTFAAPVTVASGTNARVVDIAMNASGQAVAAWDGQYLGSAVYASSANTLGGAWTTPVQLSNGAVDNQSAPTHEGDLPHVAINSSGTAVDVAA